MKWKHLGRTLLCLLLVCVLLVNISPIRADASGLAVGTLLVNAWPVIKAAAIGLGVVGITDSMVDGLVETLKTEGVIDTDDNMEVCHFGDGLFGVSELLLEFIRDDLFNRGYVEKNPAYTPYTSVTVSFADSTQNYVVTAADEFMLFYFAFTYQKGTGTYPYRYMSGVYGFAQNPNLGIKRTWLKSGNYDTIYPSYLTGVTGAYAWSGFGGGVSTSVKNASDFSGSIPSGIECVHLGYFDTYEEGQAAIYNFNPFGKSSISSEYDIELGMVSTADTFYGGYTDWGDRSVDIEGTYYAPIGSTAVAGTPSQSYTQEDVWTGQVPIIIIDQTGTGGGSTDPSESTEPKPLPGEGITVDILSTLFGGLSDKIEYVAYSIQEIPGILREFMQEVKEGLERLPGQFKEWFDDIRAKLQQLVTGQITLADLLNGLYQPVLDAIVDALAYLFAPGEAFIKTQVESLIAKYPFAQAFYGLGTDLKTYFFDIGAQPPIIYIDLGSANGSYYLGGREVFVDLTWYSQYKPTVDALIGAFIWLWFAWRVWLSLPGIIQGMSGFWGDRNEHPDASFTTPSYESRQNWLNSGSFYHRKGGRE